jgi:hypothetical protein
MTLGLFSLAVTFALAGLGIIVTQGQNSWVPSNHWLAPSLFVIAGIFLLRAISNTAWYRRLQMRAWELPSQEHTPQKTVHSETHGDRSRIATIGSIGSIGPGAKVYVGGTHDMPAQSQIPSGIPAPAKAPADAERRLVIKTGSNIELFRSPTEVVSAFGFTIRNSYIRRQNIVHNLRATLTFSHFDVETFKVQAMFARDGIGRQGDPSLESTVSLRHGDMCHLLVLASRDKIPLMAAARAKYHTISTWPLNGSKEHHLYDVEWVVKLELSSDSPEESITAEYILQVFPATPGGYSFSPKPPSQ